MRLTATAYDLDLDTVQLIPLDVATPVPVSPAAAKAALAATPAGEAVRGG